MNFSEIRVPLKTRLCERNARSEKRKTGVNWHVNEDLSITATSKFAAEVEFLDAPISLAEDLLECIEGLARYPQVKSVYLFGSRATSKFHDKSDYDLAISMPENNSVIRRFEIVIELFWKTFKVFLENLDVIAPSPRPAAEEAFKQGWIADPQYWSDMIKDRNVLSHAYKTSEARRIYKAVPEYFKIMEITYNNLRKTLSV